MNVFWSVSRATSVFKHTSLRQRRRVRISQNHWKKWQPCYVNLLFCVYLLILLVFFFKLKLILFYNRVVYYYTRIFLNLLPHPVGWMCAQRDENDEFWKEDITKVFLALRSVHSNDWETSQLFRNECPFYHECRHSIKVFSWLQTGLSDNRLLSSKAWGCRLKMRNVTKKKNCFIWPRVLVMRYLNINEESHP